MKRAFTLIELLVVIAIISILAAILFPVFAQAKASAKQTVCIVHMRQIGMAIMMYQADNSDTWPPVTSVDPLPGFAPQQVWIGYDNNNTPAFGGFVGDVTLPAINPPRPGKIDPYLKSDKIKVCPEQPGEWQMALAYNMFLPNASSPYYTTNPAAAGMEYGPGTVRVWTDPATGLLNAQGINDSQMEDHVQTLVIWEHKARVPLCNWLQSFDWFDSPPVHLPGLEAHFNHLHRKGSTTLWADGHTRRTLFVQLKRPMFSVRKDIYP